MNLSITCVLAVLALFGATAQLRAELFAAVELSDLRGNKSFQVCTDAEKLKFESELSAEARAYPKALEETKKEWQQNHADSAFPGSHLKQRTLRILTTTINRAEADKMLGQNKGREERSLASKKEEEESILKMKASRFRRGNNQAQVEQQQRKVKEEREKEAAADKAEVILRQKLSAAAGHEVPFYGETPAEQQKDASKKKKKK